MVFYHHIFCKTWYFATTRFATRRRRAREDVELSKAHPEISKDENPQEPTEHVVSNTIILGIRKTSDGLTGSPILLKKVSLRIYSATMKLINTGPVPHRSNNPDPCKFFRSWARVYNEAILVIITEGCVTKNYIGWLVIITAVITTY